MPYIEEKSRGIVWEELHPMNMGEFNYIVSTLCDIYIGQNGLNYPTLNALIGVLECAKMELYRRIAAPYEDKKCQKNGEVYISSMKIVSLTRPQQLDLFSDAEQATLTGEAKYGETKFG